MNRVEQVTSFVLVPQADLDILKAIQLQILEVLNTFQLASSKAAPPPPNYLTAVEFMRAVKICRSKFDQLAATGKINVIKKAQTLCAALRSGALFYRPFGGVTFFL